MADESLRSCSDSPLSNQSLYSSETIAANQLTPPFIVRQAKKEEAERDRIIKEHALAELEKKQAAEAAAEARKKADAEAVARWHVEQAEKAAKEKAKKEEEERELRNKMRERLLASGVPEHQIQAMIDGKRPAPPQVLPQPMPMMRPGMIPPPPPMHHPHPHPHPGPHPHPPAAVPVPPNSNTYTRMSRKHLSIEALRARAIEYELDKVCTCHESPSFPICPAWSVTNMIPLSPLKNPDYIIIKRWVPAEEQKDLWTLTRVIRDDREKITTTLTVQDRSRHHHRDKSRDNLVLVRKTKRERSRSPSVLMYLAGAR